MIAEWFCNLAQAIGLDSSAGILDRNDRLACVDRPSDGNVAARLGELDRIRNQVQQHLLQSALIGASGQVSFRSKRDIDYLHFLLACGPKHAPQELF